MVEVPTIVKVPLLPIPKLPKLTQEQSNRIPQDVFNILVKREIILKRHIERINKIIEAHNK